MSDGEEPSEGTRVYTDEEKQNATAVLEEFERAYVAALNADDASAAAPSQSVVETSLEDNERDRRQVEQAEVHFTRIALRFVSALDLPQALDELAAAMCATWSSGSKAEQTLLDTNASRYAERFFIRRPSGMKEQR